MAEVQFKFLTSPDTVNGQLICRLARFGYFQQETTDDKLSSINTEKWVTTPKGAENIANFTIANSAAGNDIEYSAQRYAAFFRGRYNGLDSMTIGMLRHTFVQGVGAVMTNESQNFELHEEARKAGHEIDW